MITAEQHSAAEQHSTLFAAADTGQDQHKCTSPLLLLLLLPLLLAAEQESLPQQAHGSTQAAAAAGGTVGPAVLPVLVALPVIIVLPCEGCTASNAADPTWASPGAVGSYVGQDAADVLTVSRVSLASLARRVCPGCSS